MGPGWSTRRRSNESRLARLRCLSSGHHVIRVTIASRPLPQRTSCRIHERRTSGTPTAVCQSTTEEFLAFRRTTSSHGIRTWFSRREAQWNQTPPVPDDWMHQMSQALGQKHPRWLDGDEFRKAVQSKLAPRCQVSDVSRAGSCKGGT